MATNLITTADFAAATRELLQDNIGEFRYADNDIILALNAGLQEAGRIAQYLFRSANYVIPFYTTVGATTVVFSTIHKPALLYYLVGWLQLRSGENGGKNDERAGAFVKQFRAELTGEA